MREIRIGDLVAGLTDDGYLTFVSVEQTHRFQWTNDMIHFKSPHVYDIIVTPDHKMCLQDADGNLYFKLASDIKRHGERTKRTAKWRGLHDASYIVPAYIEQHVIANRSGAGVATIIPITHPAVEISMGAWCEFLGLFLAEGHIDKKGLRTPYRVRMTQHSKVDRCREIVDALGLKWSYNGHHFSINSVQLATHLSTLVSGRAHEKRIPRFILDLAPEYIAKFLDGFCVGDGSVHRNQRVLYTSSRGLADDLGECFLRIGSWYRIDAPKTVQSVRIIRGVDRTCRNCYLVRERKTRKDGLLIPADYAKYEPYDGWVVCLTVPYHRLYVRRPNGPSMWCGNCGYPSSFAWAEILARPLGEVLLGVAKGTLGAMPVRKGFGYTALVCIPPFPGSEMLNKTRDFGYVYRKVLQLAAGVGVMGPVDSPQVWPLDVRINEKGQMECAGVDGVIMNVSGHGATIEQARDASHNLIKDFDLENWQARLADGPDNAIEAIPTLRAWGYDAP